MIPIPNFRDLGGFATRGNGTTVKNRLFRSGNLDHLNKTGKNLLKSLGIKTIVDLRSPVEQRKKPKPQQDIREIVLPIFLEEKYREKVSPVIYRKNNRGDIETIVSSLYASLVEETMETVGRLFRVLLQKDSYPLLIHCRAGQDRTGFVCAIILMALGVDTKAIINDYMVSRNYSVPKVRAIARTIKLVSFGFISTANFETAFTAHERYLKSIFDTITEKFGTIERYLESCGITGTDLAEFRKLVCQ